VLQCDRAIARAANEQLRVRPSVRTFVSALIKKSVTFSLFAARLGVTP
jgi:hypothetical protein